ncbi:hypothetical protein P8452_55956 [Trifolium repens]|nr:hypothetical protein P8452_55956 [Trifolium repens]
MNFTKFTIGLKFYYHIDHPVEDTNFHLNIKTPSSKCHIPNEIDKNDTVSEKSEVEVSFKPPGPTVPTMVGGGDEGSKKLKLVVLPKSGTKKIPVEMNASDNVGESQELQKLNQRLQFHLPQDGYFFIFTQNVIDDDKSFLRWHHVSQGDTIEIFHGSVTEGKDHENVVVFIFS